jgi:hypothetical protein
MSGVDRQTGRGAMAAVAHQVLCTRGEPPEQVKRRDRASRAGGQLAGLLGQREEHNRAMVALRNPCRDDANHPWMPADSRQHERGGVRLV